MDSVPFYVQQEIIRAVGLCPSQRAVSLWPGRSARECIAHTMHRQLGVELHELGRALPIFDGVTGAPVPPETDARIEALVNYLLDAAREGVDEADEGDLARPDSSLGAALDHALAAQLSGAERRAEEDLHGACLAEENASGGALVGGGADRMAEGAVDAGGATALVADAVKAAVCDGSGGAAAPGAEPVMEEASVVAARVDAGSAGAAAAPVAEPTAEGAGRRRKAECGPAGELAHAARHAAPTGTPAVQSSLPDLEAALAAGSTNAPPAEAGSSDMGPEAAAEQPTAAPHPAAAIGVPAAGTAGGERDPNAPVVGDAAEDAPAPPPASAERRAEPGSSPERAPAAWPAVGESTGELGEATASAKTVAASAEAHAEPARPPAVGPAVGVSGGELGEATTSAAEAVAEAREARLDAGGRGAAAAAALADLPHSLSEAERRLLDWHWANLEYGCSARLDQVRLCTMQRATSAS